jgi:hypothetical protein
MQNQPEWRDLLLRTEETAKKYKLAKESGKPNSGCRLCDDLDTIEEFKYWRLVPNKFPYDRYYSTSHMLQTLRHVSEAELNEEERRELFELKKGVLAERYEQVIENLPKQSSIPHHYHVHLVVIKSPEGVTT